MVNLIYQKLFISGPLRGISCESRISFTDIRTTKRYIFAIKDIQSKSGHLFDLITGDHVICGMFEIEAHQTHIPKSFHFSC